MRRFVFVLALALTFALAFAAHSKIDDFVYQAINKPGTDSIEVLVIISSYKPGLYHSRDSVLNMANQFTTKAQRGNFIFKSLKNIASHTQGDILELISSYAASHQDISFRSFWIVNSVLLSNIRSSDIAFLEQLADHADVSRISLNPRVPLQIALTPASNVHLHQSNAPATVEKSLQLINAETVWSRGIIGSGAVIAGADTGYQWDHPAIKKQYRGFSNGTVNHNYHWHDSVKSGGGKCGPKAKAPCDDGSHGTHTMGTMLGNTLSEGDAGFPTGGVAIGVAPGAQWIGCRNMNNGYGTPAQYMDCFEFFIAPTDLNGANPDPSLAPHVISNSWGCPASEGCGDEYILEGVVNATRAAGIVVAAAAGNEGSRCSTVASPIGTYPSAFSVAATDVQDKIAYFSSRGPVKRHGGLLLKPDISAPGVSIRSCVPNNSYGTMSGTSMATPHVAGLVALIIDANPSLAGNVDLIELIIKKTAVPLHTTESCGDTAGKIPNNVYGYGRIDALAAVEMAKTY